MPDTVSQYQEALNAVQQAKQRADGIMAKIASLATNVRNWQSVRITGARLRDEITLNENLPLISSDDWPAFADFKEAVSAFHKAKRDAENIWLNMDESERIGLSAPNLI